MTTSTLPQGHPVTAFDAHDLYTGLTIRHAGAWRTVARTERVQRRVHVVFEDGAEAHMPPTLAVLVLSESPS